MGALQLVFCDLGTPQNDDRWTVYDQLRVELVARGLPAEAIVFMHDARNDAEKARLFAAARAGSIAVLVGSTEKMGVGTNVQTRAVALHHMDCPWRPADLEQRDGRLLRQGNQNPEVRVIRYVTEGSFDVFSWQTVERKSAFINQVMRGDITERTIDDVGDQALSYAEVKALATGNPLILERAGVDSELTKLERLQASYRDEQASLARRVRSGERDAGEQEDLASTYRAAATRAADTSGDRFIMAIDHQSYSKRTEAATALQAVVLREQKRIPVGERRAVPFGELAGFTVVATISKDSTETSVNFSIGGVPGATPAITRDELRRSAPLGILTRLENLARDLPARADQADSRAGEARHEAAKAAGRIGQPFEHAGRIASLRARLNVIDAELAPAEPSTDETTTSAEPAADNGPGPGAGPRVQGGPRAVQTVSPPAAVHGAAAAREQQMARRRAQQRQPPGFAP